jgi:hypothetical protein
MRKVVQPDSEHAAAIMLHVAAYEDSAPMLAIFPQQVLTFAHCGPGFAHPPPPSPLLLPLLPPESPRQAVAQGTHVSAHVKSHDEQEASCDEHMSFTQVLHAPWRPSLFTSHPPPSLAVLEPLWLEPLLVEPEPPPSSLAADASSPEGEPLPPVPLEAPLPPVLVFEEHAKRAATPPTSIMNPACLTIDHLLGGAQYGGLTLGKQR